VTLVRVRRAAPGDAPRCAEIVFSALEEHGIPPDPEGLDRDVFAFGSREGRFRDLVAAFEGRIVGVVCLEPWDDKGWLSKLFVAREARGHGVGRTLLVAALEEARAQGMREVGLTTRAVFRSAIRLYEGFGFARVTDPSDAPSRAHGRDVVYRLAL